MAARRSSRKSKKNQQKLISIIIGLIAVAAIGFFGIETGVIGANQTPDTALVSNISGEHIFSMHVIDVGQGDAILLEQDGKYALVDAGETMKPSARESRDAIFAYLDAHGVKKLEFMLLTHQDYDHIGSAKEVLNRYQTAVVYDNGIEHSSETYEKLIEYMLTQDISYTIVREGDAIVSPWKNVSIEVLSPPQELIMSGQTPDINENSIVLKITATNVSYILTGDAGTKAEKYILKTNADIDSDIIKAGHHGSSDASSSAFISAVTPDIVVISVGSENSYGHPHLEALSRYAKQASNIYRTDIDGDIIVSTNGEEYTVGTRHTHDPAKMLISGNGEKVSA